MLHFFTVGLREALQCSLLLALLIGHPALRGGQRWLFAGVFAAFFAGFPLSYVSHASGLFPGSETWTSLRYLTELSIFYLGLVFAVARKEEPAGASGRALSTGLFVLGFGIYFFEARAVGFLAFDAGVMAEAVPSALGAALLGTALGFIPLLFLRKPLEGLRLGRFFSLPSLLMSLGVLMFAMGGVGEVEEGSLFITLQRGVQVFLGSAVSHLRSVFMISGHEFLDTPLSGLAGFLSGESVSLSVVVLLVFAPPVFILVRLFSTPDPLVKNLEKAAERRLTMAFFRTGLLYRSVPVLVSFLILLVSLHTVNASMNPMTEPVPVPVRESGEEGVLRIPLSDRMGEFTDGRLRKYVYYYGSKAVVFLAVLRPDGTAGVALDECEICDPAEWNKSARGYAQRGDTLVCKYCMTPIPIATVNRPGGCNPIPLPFRIEEGHIVIPLEDLIRTYREARELDKKGSHF